MKEQSKPAPHDTPLLNNHHLMRNIHPASLTSLDSGHATQYTQSITSSHTANSRGGPMRATVRPRGIAEHIPPTLCTVSSDSSTTRTHSRHRSLTPCGGALSDVDTAHFQESSSIDSRLSHRRSQSMEALHSQEDGDCENCSCHSHTSSHTVSTGGRTTVLSTRNNAVGMEGSKKHSSSCGELRATYDKENGSATMKSTARKANSETSSVSSRQRQRLGSSSAPFKDRTNSVANSTSNRSTGHKSNGVSTTEKPKLRTLTELVPPLNAARLRPIQQQTRSANVSCKNN